MLIKTEVFVVNQNETERDRGVPEWAFSSEGTAKLVCRGRGWWGGDAPVHKMSAVVDDETGECHLIQKTVKLNKCPGYKTEIELMEDLKSKALEKLTAAEKQLLGLTCNRSS